MTWQTVVYAAAARKSLENNKEFELKSILETEEGESPSPFLQEGKEAVTQEFALSSDMDCHRLDFAVSRILGISRGFAQKLIRNGSVSILPQRRIKPSIKVSEGDLLYVTVPPAEELDLEPEDVAFDVVYSDNDIIVINKPSGLVVHPAPGHWTGTLVHGLLYRFPDIGSLNGVKRPGIVHRLDGTTSGLMVAARNGLAQEGLFRDFKARRVEKEYIALCFGTPPSQKGEIRYPIGRDPYNKLKMAVTEDGREAHTDFNVLWGTDSYSLIRLKLHSGRTHQIRVHMAALGSPLVGDKLYAPSRPSPFECGRVFLHSWKLSFVHPRSMDTMSFTQPLPYELSNFLNKIRQKEIH